MRLKMLQFLKFSMVGASNTLISFIIYYLMIFLEINYLIANIGGYIISSLWGYILNKIWVFKENNQKVSKSVTRYYVVYLVSFLINLCIMYILVDVLQVSTIMAPFFTMCITVPFNFIMSKLWVFKERKDDTGKKIYR